MPDFVTPVNPWDQMSLLPPVAVELSLKVGIMTDEDHAQVQIEAHDATTGELLGMRSWPHLTLQQLDSRLPELASEFMGAVYMRTGPF